MEASYLPIVTDLITFRLEFMRPDEHLQVVPFKEPGSDIRPEVAASSSPLVGCATILAPWVTPQNVQDLATAKARTEPVAG